jgi:hypothetical protein
MTILCIGAVMVIFSGHSPKAGKSTLFLNKAAHFSEKSLFLPP